MTEVVYLIGSPGSNVVKIGHSASVHKRLAAIRTMSPLPLEVFWTTEGDGSLEAVLHQAFAERRLHGEWFEFDSREGAVKAVADVAEAHRRAQAMRETGEYLTGDEVRAELRELVRQRNEHDRTIDELIVRARAEVPPVGYAELEEITGLSREWLRKIAKGTAPARRPRRAAEPTTDHTPASAVHRPAMHSPFLAATGPAAKVAVLPPASITELVDQLRIADRPWFDRVQAECERTDPNNLQRAIVIRALAEGKLPEPAVL